MRWKRFLLCLFLGFSGVHKFAEKKTGLGFIYLFTCGIFGIGWIYDCIMYLKAAVTGRTECVSNESIEADNVLTVAGTVIFALLAIVGLPGLSGFLGLAGAVFCLPAVRWQDLLNSRINRVIRAGIIIVMLAACVMLTPSADTVKNTLPADDAANSAMTGTTDISSAGPMPDHSAEAADEPAVIPAAETTGIPAVTPAEPQADENTYAEYSYILNTSSKRFHHPSCPSVAQMKDINKKEYHGIRDTLIEDGYKPCGNCEP